MSGFKPGCLCAREVIYPLCYAPRAGLILNKSSTEPEDRLGESLAKFFAFLRQGVYFKKVKPIYAGFKTDLGINEHDLKLNWP